ncbi:MAG: DUF1801 domain-containing protein [Bacteroidota bacterium]
MQSKAATVTEYMDSLPEERKAVMLQLRDTINANIPAGFKETIGYGMIGWVIPHSDYPAGYHCNPKLPLPFLNLASQKNFIALYHMGIYSNPELLTWFTNEYPKHCKTKLDMGKSCIRFKKMNDIPLELIGELVSKVTPELWIEWYEKVLNRQ